VQACVLQSCGAYRLPTPFSCFPFTSPSVRHRVPSHFKRSIPSWKPTSVRMRWILKIFACKCTENSNWHKCLSARRPQPPWFSYGQTYCTVLICLRFYWLSILVNCIGRHFNTLRTGLFKLFKRPFPGFFNNFNPLNAELNPICFAVIISSPFSPR